MSWLNHFLDYETIEGFAGRTGHTGHTGQRGFTGFTGYVGNIYTNQSLGETGATGEPYQEFFKNIYYLIIYFSLFLMCFFLGGPFIFYYFVLIKAGYFPTNDKYLKLDTTPNPIDPETQKVLDLKKMLNKHSFYSNTLYTEYMNDDEEGRVEIPLILNTKGYNSYFLKRPDYPNENGEIIDKENNQMFIWRYFRKSLSVSSLTYYYFSSAIVKLGIPFMIFLLMAVMLSSLIVIIQGNKQGWPKASSLYSLIFSVPGTLLGVMSIIGLFSSLFSGICMGRKYTGDTDPETAYRLWTDAEGFWSWSGGAWFCLRCWIAVFIAIGGTALMSSLWPLIFFGLIFLTMIGTQGCYIYEGKKHPLNIGGIFHLFFIYCTIFFKWFYELILLVLIFLAVTINAKLGAWVTIVTLISWFINRKKLSNFRQNFLQKMHIDAEDWLTANARNLALYNPDADATGCDNSEKDADGNLTATTTLSAQDKEALDNAKAYGYKHNAATDLAAISAGVAGPPVGAAVGTLVGVPYLAYQGAQYLGPKIEEGVKSASKEIGESYMKNIGTPIDEYKKKIKSVDLGDIARNAVDKSYQNVKESLKNSYKPRDNSTNSSDGPQLPDDYLLSNPASSNSSTDGASLDDNSQPPSLFSRARNMFRRSPSPANPSANVDETSRATNLRQPMQNQRRNNVDENSGAIELRDLASQINPGASRESSNIDFETDRGSISNEDGVEMQPVRNPAGGKINSRKNIKRKK